MKTIEKDTGAAKDLYVEHFRNALISAYSLEEKLYGEIKGNKLFSAELRSLNDFIRENTERKSALRLELQELYRAFLMPERLAQLKGKIQFQDDNNPSKVDYSKVIASGNALFEKMQLEIDSLTE